MGYSSDMLETIKDHVIDSENDFTYDEQIDYTIEIMEEFYSVTLTIDEAIELYDIALEEYE